MKLLNLWLENYYNLQDVAINFGDAPSLYGSTTVRFLIGLNGTGKSNALNAVGLIFSSLAAGFDAGFGYDIEYELRNQIIRITTRSVFNVAAAPLDPIGATVLVRRVEEPEWEPHHIRKQWASSGAELLPGRIVGYSTGPTSGLNWALNQSIERRVRTEQGEAELEVKPEGMSDDEWTADREALRESFEQQLEAYRDNPTTIFLDEEDALLAALALLVHPGAVGEEGERFRALRSRITDRLGLDQHQALAAFTLHVSGRWDYSLTPMRSSRFRSLLSIATTRRPVDLIGTPVSESEDVYRDFYAVFDLDAHMRMQALPELAPTPLVLFEDLLAAKRQAGMFRAHLVLQKSGVRSLLPDSALSDGEFLYLGRYALMLMVSSIPECLVLFDEPETHFNDHWKVDLISDVAALMDTSDSRGESTLGSSEVIIATHSDLTLTDADPNHIQLFKLIRKVEPSGPRLRIEVSPPGTSSFAADRSAISRNYFGATSPIGTFAKRTVDSALESGDEAVLRRLMATAGPGYSRFRLGDRLAEIEAPDQEPSDA